MCAKAMKYEPDEIRSWGGTNRDAQAFQELADYIQSLHADVDRLRKRNHGLHDQLTFYKAQAATMGTQLVRIADAWDAQMRPTMMNVSGVKDILRERRSS